MGEPGASGECAGLARVSGTVVPMRVFTCNDFTGMWPVGTAAVVVATDERHAEHLMRDELKRRRLPLDAFTLEEVDVSTPQAVVLRDGN